MPPLPYIPRRAIKPNGKVDLWDLIGQPTGKKDEKTGFEITDGPVKIEFNSILAREALQRDPDRYKIDLPRGVKPGPGQIAFEERQRAEAEELEAEANRDPVYGNRSQQ